MPSLSTINNDVILEIGACLRNEKSALCALALVSRNLSQLMKSLIFHTIEVWVQDDTTIRIERTCGLMQTLKSQPSLGAMTHTLRLKWPCDSGVHTTNKEAAKERAETFLSYTPNICILDIQNWSHTCNPFTPSPHLLQRCRLLREITISDSRYTVDDVAMIMQEVPGLRSFHVQGLSNSVLPSFQNVSDAENSKAAPQMTRLELHKGSHTHRSIVHFLLTIASGLKYLSTDLPGLQPELRRGMAAFWDRSEQFMLENLSPAKSLECLRPVQETLVELHITDEGIKWPGHDGSRFDLTAFDCLRLLSLCAVCVFPPESSWASRKGLYKLLPSSIEDITVSFGAGDSRWKEDCRIYH